MPTWLSGLGVLGSGGPGRYRNWQLVCGAQVYRLVMRERVMYRRTILVCGCEYPISSQISQLSRVKREEFIIPNSPIEIPQIRKICTKAVFHVVKFGLQKFIFFFQ